MNAMALIGAAWIGFWMYWLCQIDWMRKTDAALDPWIDRAQGGVVALCVAIMLLGWSGLGLGDVQLWTVLSVPGLLLTAAGLGLASWAGVQLGKHWSNEVAVVKDQPLVETGPYKYLRHPVYAGLLLAAFGTWLAAGRLSATLAFLAVAAAYLHKALREDRFLMAKLGERYQAYAKRAQRLVPKYW